MTPAWLGAPFARFVAGMQADRLAHAWLVAGPRGLGKRELAGRMAAAALCVDRLEGGDACGNCRGCQLLRAGTHPDLYTVGLELNDRGTSRSEIVIDQVRTLAERLAQTSHAGGRRVALIDPADAMNLSSANALLKTLEEPPPAVVILLVSDQPGRLLPTVRSRCQNLDLRIPEQSEALDWLVRLGISRDVASRALLLAAGNPGEALAIARNGAVAEGVLDDLAALRRGSSASEMARRWVADEFAGMRLDIALQVMRAALAALVGGESPADPRMRSLTEGLEVAQLSQRFDQLGRLRARLTAPLRHELLLLDWLRQWSPATTVARRTNTRGSG